MGQASSALMGPPGPPGVGVQDAVYDTTTGKLTIKTTEPDKQFGPFDVRGRDAVVDYIQLVNRTVNDNNFRTQLQSMLPSVLPKGDKGEDGTGILSADYNTTTGNLTLNTTKQGVLGPFPVRGSPGLPGAGISNAIVTNGNLILTATDNTTFGPFPVRGPQGPDGLGIKSVSYTGGNLRFTRSDDSVLGPYNIVGPAGIGIKMRQWMLMETCFSRKPMILHLDHGISEVHKVFKVLLEQEGLLVRQGLRE